MKNKRVKFQKLLSLFLTLVFVLCAVPPMNVSAASRKPVLLANKKVYTVSDFTGSGKKAKLKVVYNGVGGGSDADIYVNGKKLLNFQFGKGGFVYYCKVNKKDSYLLIENGHTGGCSSCWVYRYQKGKLVSGLSASASEPGEPALLEIPGGFYGGASKIDGNYIYFTYDLYRLGSRNILGTSLKCSAKFKIKNHKLVRVSRYATLNKTITAPKSFTTSTKHNAINSNGVYVPQYAKIKLSKIYFPPKDSPIYNKVMVKVTYGSKTGWVDCTQYL